MTDRQGRMAAIVQQSSREIPPDLMNSGAPEIPIARTETSVLAEFLSTTGPEDVYRPEHATKHKKGGIISLDFLRRKKSIPEVVRSVPTPHALPKVTADGVPYHEIKALHSNNASDQNPKQASVLISSRVSETSSAGSPIDSHDFPAIQFNNEHVQAISIALRSPESRSSLDQKRFTFPRPQAQSRLHEDFSSHDPIEHTGRPVGTRSTAEDYISLGDSPTQPIVAQFPSPDALFRASSSTSEIHGILRHEEQHLRTISEDSPHASNDSKQSASKGLDLARKLMLRNTQDVQHASVDETDILSVTQSMDQSVDKRAPVVEHPGANLDTDKISPVALGGEPQSITGRLRKAAAIHTDADEPKDAPPVLTRELPIILERRHSSASSSLSDVLNYGQTKESALPLNQQQLSRTRTNSEQPVAPEIDLPTAAIVPNTQESANEMRDKIRLLEDRNRLLEDALAALMAERKTRLN